MSINQYKTKHNNIKEKKGREEQKGKEEKKRKDEDNERKDSGGAKVGKEKRENGKNQLLISTRVAAFFISDGILDQLEPL